MTRNKLGIMLTIACALIVLSGFAYSEPQGTKEQKVRKLMALTGASDLGKQLMDGMMNQFATMPNLPPGFIDKFKQLAKGDDLVNLVVPVYMKNLDEKDIEAAIAFYETPSGKRFVQAQPTMVAESMQVGQKWGAEMAEEAMRQLKQQ